MKVIRWLLRILLFTFLFALAVRNGQSVTLYFFLGYSYDLPLSLLLLATFLAGALLGIVVTLGGRLRQWRKARRLQVQLRHSRPVEN